MYISHQGLIKPTVGAWLLTWLNIIIQCSPQAKFKACQGTTVGHTLGGGCGHIKAFKISLFTHQREFCTEGLLGRHALYICWGEHCNP